MANLPRLINAPILHIADCFFVLKIQNFTYFENNFDINLTENKEFISLPDEFQTIPVHQLFQLQLVHLTAFLNIQDHLLSRHNRVGLSTSSPCSLVMRPNPTRSDKEKKKEFYIKLFQRTKCLNTL